MLLVQLLIADIVAIKHKHTPGYPIEPDHDSFLFRAARAHSNTNESIAIFVLVALFCILSNAQPVYTAYASWGFVLTRTAYALCYYFNFRTCRSVVFGISLLFLFLLLVLGIGAQL